MIESVTNAGSIPALERMIQFSGRRHRLLVHNIANLSTPRFRPVDVSVEDFQNHMGEAIDKRRERHGDNGGALRVEDSRQLKFHENAMTLRPEPIGGNLLFHDENDRDLERLMQGLTENFMAFRFASEMIRSRFDLIDTAIRGRL